MPSRKKKQPAMRLRPLIMRQVQAEGPVSFRHIFAYCRAQSPVKPVMDYQVTAELNRLLYEGFVCLYESGEEFITGPNTYAE